MILGLGAMLLAVSVNVRAEESSTAPARKTVEEIEAYKQKLRQEKAASRETYIAEQKARKTEFLQKASELRDQKKKELVQKVSDRMCKINENRLAAMQKHLETMGTILGRVEAQAEKAEARGADVTRVDLAVVTAKEAIKTAMDAVADQGEVDCGVTLSGEDSRVKSEAATAIKELEGELKAVHEKVKAAREATSAAIKALAFAMGEREPAGVKEAN